MTDHIDCPCGWSRIILDGETPEEARAKHEGTAIHEIALRELELARTAFDPDPTTYVPHPFKGDGAWCLACGREYEALIGPLTDMHFECSHEERHESSTLDAALCKGCGMFVAPIGPEDDKGRPTWEIL